MGGGCERWGAGKKGERIKKKGVLHCIGGGGGRLPSSILLSHVTGEGKKRRYDREKKAQVSVPRGSGEGRNLLRAEAGRRWGEGKGEKKKMMPSIFTS